MAEQPNGHDAAVLTEQEPEAFPSEVDDITEIDGQFRTLYSHRDGKWFLREEARLQHELINREFELELLRRENECLKLQVEGLRWRCKGLEAQLVVDSLPKPEPERKPEVGEFTAMLRRLKAMTSH